MSLLPENKPKKKNITPTKFFVWGQSMSGKTYLAREFPNPIILNTDGNAQKVSTPSVEVENFENFLKLVNELIDTDNEYQTVIVDLVDDVQTMLDDFVCRSLGIDDLADAPYGKAFSKTKQIWKRLFMRISSSPLNFVFISHVIEINDNKTKQTTQIPSLPLKYYNMVMGRSDCSIKTSKIGTTYLRICVERRDKYTKADIKDKDVLKVLSTVRNLVDGAKSATSSTKGLKPKAKLVPKTKESIPKKTKSVSKPTDSVDLNKLKPLKTKRVEGKTILRKETIKLAKK